MECRKTARIPLAVFRLVHQLELMASRLNIEVGSPLLKLRTMFFDESRPVRYLEVLASPSTFELHMAFGPDVRGPGCERRTCAVENRVRFHAAIGVTANACVWPRTGCRNRVRSFGRRSAVCYPGRGKARPEQSVVGRVKPRAQDTCRRDAFP
jgi:hypothetical protein